MAVTFNGPIKVSRPGFSVSGTVPGDTVVINRQAWVAPVLSILAVDIASGSPAANFPSAVVPAGSLIVAVEAFVLTNTASSGFSLTLGGTAFAQVGFTAGATGVFQGGASAAQLATWLNTGTSDLVLGTSGVTGLTGTAIVTLVLRNADGSLSDEGYRPFAA